MGRGVVLGALPRGSSGGGGGRREGGGSVYRGSDVDGSDDDARSWLNYDALLALDDANVKRGVRPEVLARLPLVSRPGV